MVALDVPVWPENQQIFAVDPTIGLTRFADMIRYHGPIIERILREEESAKHLRPAFGPQLKCTKIRRPDLWSLPEFDLLNARAEMLFRQVLKSDRMAIDACWANVYRKWSAISPHSHRRAVASLVYCLDEGASDPDNPESGQFAFVDPRLKSCCPLEEGRMTNALCPDFKSGSMLIFPAQMMHYVKTFTGDRPRITVSWNMSQDPISSSATEQTPVQ